MDDDDAKKLGMEAMRRKCPSRCEISPKKGTSEEDDIKDPRERDRAKEAVGTFWTWHEAEADVVQAYDLIEKKSWVEDEEQTAEKRREGGEGGGIIIGQEECVNVSCDDVD